MKNIVKFIHTRNLQDVHENAYLETKLGVDYKVFLHREKLVL